MFIQCNKRTILLLYVWLSLFLNSVNGQDDNLKLMMNFAAAAKPKFEFSQAIFVDFLLEEEYSTQLVDLPMNYINSDDSGIFEFFLDQNEEVAEPLAFFFRKGIFMIHLAMQKSKSKSGPVMITILYVYFRPYF